MDSFTDYISLGSNCFIKKYLDHIKKTAETHYFDYIGTSVWSIIDLFNNNFIDFTNKKLIEKIKITDKDNDSSVFTNKKYYIRLLHEFNHKLDVINDKEFKVFVDKYTRRKDRFINLLNADNKKILFMRLAENNQNRIMYNEYKEKHLDNEMNDLIKLSKMFKRMYPNIKFAILHINSNDKLLFDKKNSIVSVPCTEQICWANAEKVIKNVIEKNKQFIYRKLNKLMIKM